MAMASLPVRSVEKWQKKALEKGDYLQGNNA